MLENDARSKERACSSQIAIRRLHRTWVKRLSPFAIASFLIPEMNTGSLIHFEIEKGRNHDGCVRILNERGSYESLCHRELVPLVDRPLGGNCSGRLYHVAPG